MPEQQIRSQSGHGLRTHLGKLVEALEGVVFGRVPKPEPRPLATVVPVPEADRRQLRGLGEALERIAAREAEEAAARLHAAR